MTPSRASSTLHIANPATTKEPRIGPALTFCGRSTWALTLWATPELTDRADFLPNVHRCKVCEGRKR